MMEGSEAGIMDGETQVRWTLGSSHDTQYRRPRRVAAGSDEQAVTLHTGLNPVAVETVAEASHPRLVGSAHTQIAL
jgi:hypothetical protein